MVLLPAALQQEAGFKGNGGEGASGKETGAKKSGRGSQTQTPAGPGRQCAGVKQTRLQTLEEGLCLGHCHGLSMRLLASLWSWTLPSL